MPEAEEIELELDPQSKPRPRFKTKYPWAKLVVYPTPGSTFLVRVNPSEQFLVKRRILATNLRNLARYHAGRTGKCFQVRACPEGVRVYRMK